jgi:hypothetical protein
MNGTLTVTSAPITVTADPQTKVYDNKPSTDPALTYKITSGSLFNGDTFPGSFTGSLTRDTGESVGVYSINRGSLALNNNYDLTFATSTFTITAATSTVSISNLNQTYGSTIPVIATTTPANLFTNITYTNSNYPSSTTLPINAGTYTVVATITDPNYTGSTTGSLIIKPAPLTVTATTTTKTYDASTSSDGVPSITTGKLFYNDSAVWTQTYNSKNVGNNKILTPAGTITDGNGGANYAVTYATTTGVINHAPLTVSATGVNKTYDGTNVATVTLSDDRITGDVLTATDTKATFIGSTPFNGANVGDNKPISVQGISISGTDSGNYTLTNTTASTTADIASSTLTITANNITKTYGDTVILGATSTGFTVSGLFSGAGDSITGITLASDGAASTSPVVNSSYAITPSDAQGTGLGNYTIVYDNGNLTVNPKTLSTYNSLFVSNKVYDGTTVASTSCSLTGIINNDQVNCVTTNGEFSSRNATTIGEGWLVTATLSIGGTNAGNYTLGTDTTATAHAFISPLPITVTAQANTKPYDGTNSASASPTLSSSLGQGDTANFIETYANKNVGSGLVLTPSGTIHDGTLPDGNGGLNYTVIIASSTNGVITAEPLTITATTNTKTYDASTSAAAFPTVTSGTIFGTDTPNFTETYDTAIVGTDKTLTATGTVNDSFGGADYTYTFVKNDTGVINQATPELSYGTNNVVDGETYSESMLSDPFAWVGNDSNQVLGKFVLDPVGGVISGPIGTPLQIGITFTPSDTTDFSTVNQRATFTVVGSN